MDLLNKIKESTNFIKERIDIEPKIGLILGSGLGSLADEIENPTFIEYKEIPHFPTSTVKGHKGRLVIGELEGKKVIAMQGRFHYYEGYSLQEVTFPVRVMKALGVEKIIVTNAAGGVNKEFTPGDLMVIEDHINFAFDNPLIGKNYEELGPRFPDMSHAYSERLIDLTFKVGEELGIQMKRGTYVFMSGPTYETPAEIRMASFLGGDAVGMSTVPEVLVAVHSGIEVLGISCITNMAAGILDQPLDHSEVIETTIKVKNKFIKLVKNVLKEI
ncbi:purine-nucleoside phosphorylase [Caloranaerobacter azorensis DSM 13643]|uniref:Purine nucleoside phosphorylase n=1 Tax=Caloranaerobacter azorensis DSM 13643 TaxID=1121264 RepID=A0A1M5TBY3_9FIRM|nr:purine-nucleoside phosphorylase [Caloranaerobacter azorensis]SHH48228.1 purine-nucleoside phosphorylase [Caloranaerobacter azorensis DSM 13643]